MKVLPFTTDTLKYAVSILKKGGVIAHPADTCFGLTADISSIKAFKKIQDVKGRDYKKPMSIMISVVDQLKMKEYVQMDDFSSFVADRLFPGAVTLVMPKGQKIPEHYFPDLQTVGLRVPLHNLTQDMLTAFKGPLITTSANPSCESLCFSHEEVIESFKNSEVKPDLIFEGRISHNELASTVISIKDDKIRILRKGPVTKSQLESILGFKVIE